MLTLLVLPSITMLRICALTATTKSIKVNKLISRKFHENCTCTSLCECNFFVILRPRNGGDFLTIEEYIKSKEKFHLMPFVTIYTAIMELINDGFIDKKAFEKGGGENVAVCEQKPKRTFSGGLYGESYFHSDR